MKKFTLFSVGGIAPAILIVFLTAVAMSNTTLPESTVSETLVADTTAVTETEKISEATETAVVKPTEKEVTPTAETTDPPKAKRNCCTCHPNHQDQTSPRTGRIRFDHRRLP